MDAASNKTWLSRQARIGLTSSSEVGCRGRPIKMKANAEPGTPVIQSWYCNICVLYLPRRRNAVPISAYEGQSAEGGGRAGRWPISSSGEVPAYRDLKGFDFLSSEINEAPGYLVLIRAATRFGGAEDCAGYNQ